MSSFDNLVKDVLNEITGLARERLGGLVNEARKDAESFLESTKEDFERWLKLLNDGQLTRDDFVWLAKSKKDLVEMFALKQSGLSLVKAQGFADSLLDLIIGAAFRLIA